MEKMTRDEAIEILKAIYFLDEKKQEAFNVAIEALEQYENAFEHGYTEAESEYREILERKRGEWLGKPLGGYSTVRCSVCRSAFLENSGKWNFCPNCGADMRERK